MVNHNPLLIIVHPGSACGSADMNLGRDNADMQRGLMQMLVEGWEGGIVVIDGDFSDELAPNYGRHAWEQWGATINNALEQAQRSGHLSLRVMGDDAGMSDLNQMQAVSKLVTDQGLTPQNTAITLTGAWIGDDGDGCVHSVREELEKFGFIPLIEDAMDLNFESAELDNEGEDQSFSPSSWRPSF